MPRCSTVSTSTTFNHRIPVPHPVAPAADRRRRGGPGHPVPLPTAEGRIVNDRVPGRPVGPHRDPDAAAAVLRRRAAEHAGPDEYDQRVPTDPAPRRKLTPSHDAAPAPSRARVDADTAWTVRELGFGYPASSHSLINPSNTFRRRIRTLSRSPTGAGRASWSGECGSRPPNTISHWLHWSTWRRRHQATAKTSQYRRRGQLAPHRHPHNEPGLSSWSGPTPDSELSFVLVTQKPCQVHATALEPARSGLLTSATSVDATSWPVAAQLLGLVSDLRVHARASQRG